MKNNIVDKTRSSYWYLYAFDGPVDYSRNVTLVEFVPGETNEETFRSKKRISLEYRDYLESIDYRVKNKKQGIELLRKTLHLGKEIPAKQWEEL